MTQPAEKAYFRFTVLFFNCLLTFGSFFCFDMPSVLQDNFQGTLTCPNVTVINGTVDCVEGLGLNPQQFNLLYVTYAWTNVVVMIVAGFLVDKWGNRFGVFVSSFLCVFGSALFALGPYLKGTQYLLPVLLLGRIVFGTGNGSLIIVQNRITALWFKDKELAMAFGVSMSSSRLGSVLNFFITAGFQERYGLQWTLWGGTILCALSFICAIIVGAMDKIGMKQLGRDGAIEAESRKVRIQDVKLLSLRYWLLALTSVFFYNCIFPFVSDGSKFIQDKFSSYSPREAAYIVGVIYFAPLFLSPLLGILVDYVGLRGIFAGVCGVLTLPVFGLLAFTYVPPLVSTLCLGVGFSLAAASMWPSIPLVVPQATLGTAIGLFFAIVMFGFGVSNLVIGHILGTKLRGIKISLWRWQGAMIYMLANGILCIVTSVVLNIVDYRQDGTLNKTSKRSERSEQDSDRQMLTQGKGNQKENGEDKVVKYRSINS